MRKEKDKLGREKDSSMQRDREFKLILRLPDKCNSKKNKALSLSKLELKERTTCFRSRNKSKSNSKKERLKRRRRTLSSITPSKL